MLSLNLTLTPTPRIEDLLDILGGAKFMNTLNLTQGYWQIPLDADAQEKSAFRVESGLSEFKVSLFGLQDSGAIFMRFINEVLQGLETFARAYVDDLASHFQQLLARSHKPRGNCVT
ncbi:unnamed protein product [Natator depressus]